jgi:hypothetical protein
MKMAEEQVLSARKLLEDVYSNLTSGGKEIRFSSRARAIIADDWDHQAHSNYESIKIIKVGNNEFAASFGTVSGGYLADPYNCDIAIVQLTGDGKSDEQIAIEVHKNLERNSDFSSSIIYAMADGQLMVNGNGPFGRKAFYLLRPIIQDFIAQELEIDPLRLLAAGRPAVTSSIKYKSEFVVPLCSVLQKALQ